MGVLMSVEMSVATRFFIKAVKPITIVSSHKEPKLVNCGCNKESPFNALSLGIIDNFLARPKTHEPLLQILSEQHAEYFEPPKLLGCVDFPSQRFQRMLKSKPMGYSILQMAATLRQIAVDEMRDHFDSLEYRSALQETPLTVMRKPNAWFQENAFAALGRVLNLCLVAHVGEKGQLCKQVPYGSPSTSSFDPVILHVQGSHYSTEIRKVDSFDLEDGSMPVFKKNPNDPELSVLLESIRIADEALANDFEEITEQLQSLLAKGLHDKDSLLEMYTQGIGTKDLDDPSQISLFLQGSQAYFAERMKNLGRDTDELKDHNENFENQFTSILIEAIARLVSLGVLELALDIDFQEKIRV